MVAETEVKTEFQLSVKKTDQRKARDGEKG